MTADDTTRIRTQLERMRALARSPEFHVRNERVSRWSTAEHLDHLAKVSTSVVRRLGEEHVDPLAGRINLMGRLVLALRWLPRGVGRTPERYTGVHCTAAELEERLARLESALDALTPQSLAASRGPIIPHPRFGPLTPAQALRFVAVHTDHHLRIIDDVLAGPRG